MRSSEYRLAAATTAAGISLAAYSGCILRYDLIGRFVFGAMWALVAAWWLARYLAARNQPR